MPPLPPTEQLGPEIEDYAPRTAPKSCGGGAQPGVVQFSRMVRDALGGGSAGIVRDCACLTADPACGHSDHHEGRAWDWSVNADSPEDLERVGQLFDWLFATDQYGNPDANARRAGITYMIWHLKPPNWDPPPDDAVGWGWNSISRTWKPYNPCARYGGKCGHPHHDHVHISFSWPGARGETSLYRMLSGELPGPGTVPLSSKTGTLMLALGAGAALAAVGYRVFRRRR